MTVPGISSPGKSPFGLPPAGKSKQAEGNPTDPGFAALLAGLVAPPGTVQALVLPLGENGEAPPPGLASGLPVLPTVPSGTLPAVVPGQPDTPQTPPDNFGQVVKALVQANQGEGDPGLSGNPHALLQTAPVAPEAPQVEAVPGLVVKPVPTDPEVSASPAGAIPADSVAETPAPGGLSPEATADPVEAALTELEQPAPAVAEGPNGSAPGQAKEQRTSGHRSNPDLTLGPERAAQVSEAREPRPVDAPGTLPGPPVSARPPAPEAAPPAESELPPSLAALRGERHEPGRLMEAISRAVNTTRDGNYTVTLRLHPEHLGEVRLQLQLNGREVSTVMEVTNAGARQQLESRGDQLRQNLSQAGLTLSGFSVSTGHDRQSPRERQQAFADQLQGRLSGGRGKVQPVTTTPAGAIEQIRGAGRRTGRLDTMA